MEKEEKVICNFRIEPQLRDKFRIKTIEKQTTMTDVVVEAIKNFIEEEKK